MKKLFIILSVAIGIVGLFLQLWIAYIYFFEPYDPDDYLHTIQIYKCVFKPLILW